MDSIKSAFLITCYNRINHTILCIESLYLFVDFDILYDVYLLDDNSDDDTYEIIKSKFPKIKCFKSEGDYFWNGGMNFLWKISSEKKYQNYIWLNDDTILHDNWNDTILSALKITLGKSLLLGTTTCPVNNKISYGGRKNINSIIKPNNNLQKCNIINGNFVLVPKYVFNQVGYLDSFFSHSLGDIDYGLRVIKNGLNNFILPCVIGFCEENNNLRYNPKSSFITKIKSLQSPLGLPYVEYVYFNFTHFGFFKALKFTTGIIVSLLFPKIYLKISR